MGRPKKAIDGEMVEKLAAVGCTVGEIASVLGCNRSTLQRRFAAAIEKGGERGNASLRKKQFELAMAGNATMLIWLGKQRMGQRDTQSVEHSGPNGGAIPHAIDVVLTDDASQYPDDESARTG